MFKEIAAIIEIIIIIGLISYILFIWKWLIWHID